MILYRKNYCVNAPRMPVVDQTNSGNLYPTQRSNIKFPLPCGSMAESGAERLRHFKTKTLGSL